MPKKSDLPPGYVSFNVILPERLRRITKVRAAVLDVNIGEVVATALEQYFGEGDGQLGRTTNVTPPERLVKLVTELAAEGREEALQQAEKRLRILLDSAREINAREGHGGPAPNSGKTGKVG